MPRVLHRSTISMLVDPKGALQFFQQVLNTEDLDGDDSTLPSVDISDLPSIQHCGEVIISGQYQSIRSSDTRILLELAFLAALVRSISPISPSMVFELGTFMGRCTRLFASNSPDDCKIVTLDLPRAQVEHDVGADYRNCEFTDRIEQCYGNSLTFDFSPWYGQADFVWVDACHDYEYVASDSCQALQLCRSGGWIAWHDYRHTAWWSGVTRAVRELRTDYPGLMHLRGTTIALLKKP